MTCLLTVIQALEVELHHPGRGRDAGRLRELLHRDFYEVGRSGNEYDKATVMRFMSEQDAALPAAPDNFVLHQPAPGVALLTYRSADVQQDGTLGRHTLRSSWWVHEEGKWQMRYHQGTPAAKPW